MIDEHSYILGYWFAQKKDKSSFHCIVLKGEGGEGTWIALFGSPEGEEGENIAEMQSPPNTSEGEVIAVVNEMFGNTKVIYDHFYDHFFVRGNLDDFIKIFKTKDYADVVLVY
jgi:hypothetical protein